MNIDEAALKAEPLAVLRELLESEEAQYPAAKQGQAAQTAWVERKYAAREAARALVQLGQPVGAATAERAKAFTTHELERLAKQAGMTTALFCGSGSCVWSEGCNGVKQGHLENFAALCRTEATGIARAQQVLREMHEAQKGQPPAIDPYLFAALALDTVVPAEQAEDSAMRKDAERYRWLTKGAYIGECFTDAGTILEVHGTDKCVPIYGSVDEAIDAAISNREAGGS